MSVLNLPSRANLEYYHKQAKSLLKAVQSGDSDSVRRIQSQIPKYSYGDPILLSDAQWVIARELGFESWRKAKAAIDATSAPDSELSQPVPTIAEPDLPPAIKSDVVEAKTGKSWTAWFELFDSAGGREMNHQQLVAIARENGAGSWWQQMVAVEYEKSRGLRVKNQSCAGDFQVSVSRTINTKVEVAFDAWINEDRRTQWLSDPLTIRKATPYKSVRINWPADGSPCVMLYPKGESKCTCTVDHNKLDDFVGVDRYRAFWSAALDRLKALVES